MAYGIHCKHCGHYETAHHDGSLLTEKEWEKVVDCSYEPNDPIGEIAEHDSSSDHGDQSEFHYVLERVEYNRTKHRVPFPPTPEIIGRIGMDDFEIIMKILGRCS